MEEVVVRFRFNQSEESSSIQRISEIDPNLLQKLVEWSNRVKNHAIQEVLKKELGEEQAKRIHITS
jgi:hypothetical protein